MRMMPSKTAVYNEKSMFNVIQAPLFRCHNVSLILLKPKEFMYNYLVGVVVMVSFRETF